MWMSTWSRRQKKNVVHSRTSTQLGPFSRCAAGSFITKRVFYSTAVSIVRTLDMHKVEGLLCDFGKSCWGIV